MKQNRLSNPAQIQKAPPSIERLSDTAQDVFRFLCKLSYYTPINDVSIPEIAEAIGKGEKVAWRGKDELIKYGILFYRRNNPGCNTYWLNPEYINNPEWHKTLRDWFYLFPCFSVLAVTFSLLFSNLSALNYDPTKNKNNTPFSLASQGRGCVSLGQKDPQKGTKTSREGPVPGSEALAAVVKAEASQGSEAQTEKLISKIRESFERRTSPISLSEEIELYAFPHDALVSACNVLKGQPEAKYPKALFWAEARRATMAVPGRRPDFLGADERYKTVRAASIVPAYEICESELDIDIAILKKVVNKKSHRDIGIGYAEYTKEEAHVIKNRERDITASKYIWAQKEKNEPA